MGNYTINSTEGNPNYYGNVTINSTTGTQSIMGNVTINNLLKEPESIQKKFQFKIILLIQIHVNKRI